MALNGINLVLAYTGREYVYRKVYQKLGLNASSIELGRGGIEAGPAFLAFSRTENYGAYDHVTPNGGRTGGPVETHTSLCAVCAAVCRRVHQRVL